MVRKQPMRVVVLANSKGGVGKTTLAAALAVRAAAESKRVALLDLDPQESLSAWWERRGKEKNPKLFEVDAATEAIELLMSEGWDWVFIDTPPSKLELIEPGVAAADLVLIPCRPSALDIEQVDIVVELCETHGKPFAFVLNHAPPTWKLTKSSAEYLRRGERTVLDPLVTFRQAHMAAATVGKTAAEVEKEGAARREIDELWEAVKKLAATARKGRAK